jgi:predicted DNA-binding transcriptional regulator AlpA
MNKKAHWATGGGYTTGPQKPILVPPDAKFLSAKQVCARYGGRSHMWLQRKIDNDPDFPKPKKIGRLRFWEITKLEAYERSI